MSHRCHDEHGGQGGHHHHDEHDHSDDVSPAVQFSLYQQINFDEINTLNEAQYGSGKAIVKKTWAERFDEAPELASEADEQLLINVPWVLPQLSGPAPWSRRSAEGGTSIYLTRTQFHRASQAPRRSAADIELGQRAKDAEGFHQPRRHRL
jgi:hypothetical protein